MSLAANIFGRDSGIFKAWNVLAGGAPAWLDKKFGPPETEGPRLSDLSIQTSTYGADIARVYGTIAIAGNITWLEGGKLKEVVKKNKQGGKGGASSEPDKTYTYYATFHLMLCLGEIQGIRRIWCSDKLIYDAGSDDLETIIASNDAARGWTLYRGTDDQMPDPRYEADVGVENASANRGIAYLAFRDWNLTDYGNSLQGSQFKIELVGQAAGGVELVRSLQVPYYQPFTNQTFTALPVYVDENGAVFNNPQWDNNYPPSSEIIATDIFLTGYSNASRHPVAYPRVPCHGDSDNKGTLYTRASQIFNHTPGLVLSGSSGYWQQRGGVTAATTVFPYNFFCRTGDSPEAYSFIAPAPPCFAIGPDCVFLIFPDRIEERSFELDLISSHTFALPAMSYPAARAEVSAGVILIFDGYNTVFRVADDFSGYTTLTSLPSLPSSDYYARSVHLSESMIVVATATSAGGVRYQDIRWYAVKVIDPTAPALADVIRREVELSNLLTASDIDVSLIDRDVRGYRVAGGTIRSALEPLATAFQFDVIQSGYKLKFIPRGGASVLTVPYADLGATSGDSPDEIFAQSREMDPQLPAKTTVSYLDPNREYEVSEQYAARINTEAVNEVDVELALVLEADEGAGIAEVLQNLAWLQRTDFAFSLPPTYQGLEPCDVITVNSKSAVHEVFVSEVDYTQDGRVEIKGLPSSAAVYIPNASGGEGNVPPGTIGLPGPSLFLPLDIPLVDEVSQNAPGFVGVMTGYTDGWPGATVFRSADEGQTWADVQGYSGKGGIGNATNALAVNPGYLIDQSTLSVLMISGEPEGITYDQLLTGYNYAAYGVDGRWEIMRFQNAALQADGSYTLSGFVRGDKGTEWATGLHQSGDWFVLLDDPDNAFIGVATETIGLDRLYRGITQRASIETGTDVEFSYDGVNLEPLSPVDARAMRDGSGNLSATFVRRSRLGSTWWGNGVEAPVGEATQAYQIDVMSGSTVVRTIEAATPAFTYSAANQVADFGSTQSSILFRIYQMSELVGRGFVREVTL